MKHKKIETLNHARRGKKNSKEIKKKQSRLFKGGNEKL